MTATERLETLRDQKQARIDELNKIAADEGRTKSDAERVEFQELDADIEAIKKEIADQQRAEELKAAARPVIGNGSQAASGSRDTSVVVRHAPKPEPGIRFAQLAMCLAKAKGDPGVAHNLMRRHYPMHPAVAGLKVAREEGEDFGAFVAKLAEMRTKDAIPAASSTDESWAGVLLAHNEYTADFIEFLRPRTIVGQFGQNGIPALNQIPFNVHIKGQNEGGAADWVGEGQPKPLTKFGYVDAYHGFTKIAGISVLTDEINRFSNPSAELRVRNSLADVVIARMDTDFVDPAVTATAARPASITQGVVAIPSTGTDSDAVLEDVSALFEDADDTDLPQDSAVLLMRPATARRLSLMRTITGVRDFPDVTVRGGSLAGYPVIVSNYVPAGAVILVFASEIYLSDDGTVTIDASREASIQMLDNPTNATTDHDDTTPAPTPTTLVSMFQSNSVALRAERYIHWSKRRANAVQLLSGVAWGSLGS